MIHDANELPINIELLFNLWHKSDDIHFIKVVNFLDKRPEACLEYVLDTCIRLLEDKSLEKKYSKYAIGYDRSNHIERKSESSLPGSDNFKEKYLKYKKKYLMLKKSLLTFK